MDEQKKLILLDLDGVINTYNGNFDKNFIPEIKEGAKEFLERLSKEYEIKIFTTRNRLLTSKWIIENKLDNLVTDVTNVKDPAYLHVDDRCICFNGNYDTLFDEIINFKVWNKKD